MCFVRACAGRPCVLSCCRASSCVVVPSRARARARACVLWSCILVIVMRARTHCSCSCRSYVRVRVRVRVRVHVRELTFSCCAHETHGRTCHVRATLMSQSFAGLRRNKNGLNIAWTHSQCHSNSQPQIRKQDGHFGCRKHAMAGAVNML